MEYEEVKYGMLMMVLCDREGRVYDVWITFGSVHEVRAFRERQVWKDTEQGKIGGGEDRKRDKEGRVRWL